MKNILIAFLFVFGISLNAQTVYVTNTGEKYHVSSCHYLSKSKNAIDLSDAINQGYGACKVCRPPQTVKAEQKEIKTENTESYNKNATSSQCTATTKAGNQCKRMTKSSNGKCWQHGGE